MSGRLALDVGVHGFPIARLPGLTGVGLPLSGAISGAVRIAGEPRAPAVSGNVTFTNVTFRNEPLGGGTLTVTPERGGAIRARGHLIEAHRRRRLAGPQAVGAGRRRDADARTSCAWIRSCRGCRSRSPPAASTSGTLAARIAPGRPAVAEGPAQRAVGDAAGPRRPPREVDPPAVDATPKATSR